MSARLPRSLHDALQDVERRLAEAGIDSPAAEASWLLSHLLRIDRPTLFLRRADLLAPDAERGLEEALRRRTGREPLQYILGETEFYGLPFTVRPDVLIPRPETEVLVERILERLPPCPFIADLGTGSGCIAVALARRCPRARILALDRSPEAVSLCRTNADRHDVADRILTVRGDLARPPLRAASVDVIVSNPPYIPSGDISALPPEVRDWEPHLALDGGNRGTSAYRALLETAPAALSPGGLLALELPGVAEPWVADAARRSGTFADVAVFPDLSGRPRVLLATTPAAQAAGEAGIPPK